jgi:predicted ATPase/DNA-binding XRE family transcriptional regulator
MPNTDPASHTTPDAPFGHWLKGHRKALDITQEEVAERIGCSRETIQKIELGERRPSRQIVELLAEFFRIPADERTAFAYFARSSASISSPGLREASATESIRTAPWREQRRFHTNLPAPPTPLIGRERVMERLREQLLSDRVRLITLVGAPGIGKTRIAMEAVDETLADRFPDGVFFVELAAIHNPNLVLTTIANVMGLETTGKSLMQILNKELGGKRLLLVLDNLEQVLDAAPQLAELLSAGPWLKLLATSREPLHVRGEHRFPVPPLELPNLKRLPPLHELARYPSVDLFVDRAQSILHDFDLTTANALSVASLCVSLEGLPLAIELAAARTDLLSPAQISSALIQSDSSLMLLSKGARDLPPRQRTLRTAIQWSYNLLDEDEKRTFRRLGVFIGGFTLEAAQAVGGSVSDTLKSLVDKSLVNLVNDDGSAKGLRFGMFEVVREYARDRLRASEEEVAIQSNHVLYYLGLAQQASAQLSGPEQGTWLARLEKEHANLRSDLVWSLGSSTEHDQASLVERLELALQLCVALWQFWMYHGHITEGIGWFEMAFDKMAALFGSQEIGISVAQSFSATLPSLWARASRGAGVLAFQHGDYDTAHSMAEQSMILHRELGDIPGVISALNGLGSVAQSQRDYPAARRYLLESLNMARQLGDGWRLAILLSNLGVMECELQNFDAARALYEEGLALSRAANDTYAIARALNNLGDAARYQRDYVSAHAFLQESLQLHQKLENRRGMAYTLINLGHVARDQGSYQEGASHYREALTILEEIGDKGVLAECLEGLAAVDVMSGDPGKAATLFGAAAALREVVAVPLSPAERPNYDHYLSATRAGLDEANWLAAWEEGQTMTLDDVFLLTDLT